MIKRYNAYDPTEDYNGDLVNYYGILPILKAARELSHHVVGQGEGDCNCSTCELARLIIEQTEGME